MPSPAGVVAAAAALLALAVAVAAEEAPAPPPAPPASRDVDLKTCVDNFAVHKDKIIRTQDSRATGAKYLDEVDLDAEEECLRLCCETEDCDVFVYEEKSVGSCYLFQCGPPEDFKCKFTHHVNYSSGILTVNRHLPDLESQIRLTKHEEDLSKLRKPEMPPSGNVQSAPEVPTTVSTTTTTAASKDVLEAKSESGKCKRFQFECRSNSECIAIYNACDGIPQCSDGSDEAPELACPQETQTTIPAPSNHQTTSDNNNVLQTTKTDQAESPKPNAPINQPPDQTAYHQFVAHQNVPIVSVPIPDQRPDSLTPKVQLEGVPMAQFPQYPQPQLPGWIPRQSAAVVPQATQYGDKNSHIFNHKATGLQVPEGLETRYSKYKGAMHGLHRAIGFSNGGPMQPYGEMNSVHDYPKYYGEVYRPPIQQMLDNWPQTPPAGISYRTGPFAPPSPPRRVDDVHDTNNDVHDTNNDALGWTRTDKNPAHVQDKMAHELKQHSKSERLRSKTLARQETKQKLEQSRREPPTRPKYVAGDAIAARLEMKDGLAEAPGGAILSLTLGLVVTCLMAVLIGCRLRVVRRRMRRAGKAYAHDADYLVNGMYL